MERAETTSAAAVMSVDSEGPASDPKAENGSGPAPVMVRLLASRGHSDVAVEVEDRGGGIPAEELEEVWHRGSGRHGPGRGQGLTEEKREFLASRGQFEIRSVPGAGTVFRVEIARRAIPIPVPRLWELRPLVACAIVVLLVVASALPALWPAAPVSLTIRGRSALAAYDERGRLLWSRSLGDEIMENQPVEDSPWVDIHPLHSPSGQGQLQTNPLAVYDARDRIQFIAVSTQPAQGPGRLRLLDSRGRLVWDRDLRWERPLHESLGHLICPWQVVLPWAPSKRNVLMYNIRDGSNTPSCMQFVTLQGDSLGAYYHWGHLYFVAASDLDGDGREEILLYGINNYASGDTTIFRRNPQVYIYCLALLEIPGVSGQSYPCREWPGVPPAREKAYLLIPPLESGLSYFILRLELSGVDEKGARVIDLSLSDGRIYRLDGNLLPLSLRTGDFTRAQQETPHMPCGPLVHFTRGQRTDIWMEVRKTS